MLSDSKRFCIEDLREAGWLNRRIGRNLGRNVMVVARNWKQRITKGKFNYSGGPEYPKNTNEGENHAIIRVATEIAASIDLTPFTTFQVSGRIKGNHSDENGRRWHKEPVSIKMLTTAHASWTVLVGFFRSQ